MITVISLGAGVQSSTMALMAAHREITPMPDCAIFADTQWEPEGVYEWFDWLKEHLPFPVHQISAGSIRDDQTWAGIKRRASLPYFIKGGDNTPKGIMPRQCTYEYKIAPIERFIRQELLGLYPGERAPKNVVVEQWRGISSDEAHRMRESQHSWMRVRYPLAMELKMTRADCLKWMERNGYPTPPRSACIGCPYHSDAEWLAMKRDRPSEWADAVAFDAAIRKVGENLKGEKYLHRDCIPLDQVQFKADRQADLWGEECSGMCGL